MSTKIQWTDETWNPVTGCDKVSQGCKNCYAEVIANRFWGEQEVATGVMWPQFTEAFGVQMTPEYRPRKFTDVQCHPERLDIPLHWRKPRKVFVNSMSDLFHPDVPDEFIHSVFRIMWEADKHTFQILTKRPERMFQYFSTWEPKPITELPNVWLGVSVEDQKTADERIPWLLKTPAAVRFASYEPALGPVDFEPFLSGRGETGMIYYRLQSKLDWIICGGESGPRARPMHPDWAQSVRDQCQAAGVAFFFKQHGEWRSGTMTKNPHFVGGTAVVTEGYGETTGSAFTSTSNHYRMLDNQPFIRVGKKAAGRLLDGREWNEYPVTP